MTQQNRKALKEFFKDGALPTGANFADLVDSTLNIKDDGFSWSVQNGVQISLVGNQKRLISFFVNDSQRSAPDWCFSSDPQNSKLSFVRAAANGAGNNGMDASSAGSNGADASKTRAQSLNPDGEVMNLLADGTVQVNGTIQSRARYGISGTIPADGDWHDITEELNGCQMLEVVAGVGLPGEYKGRYALLHAVAMNTFNPRRYFFNFFFNKRPIRCTHSWYLNRGDRMKLRWISKEGRQDKHAYALQLKTMSEYERDTMVQYSITRLWLNNMASGE